jgi:Fe2+ transport system protein FeoA
MFLEIRYTTIDRNDSTRHEDCSQLRHQAQPKHKVVPRRKRRSIHHKAPLSESRLTRRESYELLPQQALQTTILSMGIFPDSSFKLDHLRPVHPTLLAVVLRAECPFAEW